MAKKIGAIIFALCLFIGVFVLTLGFILIRNVGIPDGREEKTTAVITEILAHSGGNSGTEYDVFVKYEVDGKTYEKELNAYTIEYREGKTIDIIYDRDNPEKIAAPWVKDTIRIVCRFIGGSFAVFGLAGFIIVNTVGSKKKYLMEKGDLIYAKFKSVEENQYININGGAHPYQIVCEWIDPESGELYTYKSELLYKDPRDKIEGKVSQIPVYVDYKNKYKYYVDISQLLGE